MKNKIKPNCLLRLNYFNWNFFLFRWLRIRNNNYSCLKAEVLYKIRFAAKEWIKLYIYYDSYNTNSIRQFKFQKTRIIWWIFWNFGVFLQCSSYLSVVMKLTQRVITGSKLTIETLEQGVKYLKSFNKDTRTTPMRGGFAVICGKKIEIIFTALYFYMCELK